MEIGAMSLSRLSYSSCSIRMHCEQHEALLVFQK